MSGGLAMGGDIGDIGAVADELRRTAPPGLLERMAAVLVATLETDAVLDGLASAAVDAIGAERCTFLLLKGDLLTPAASSSARPDPETWERFLAMPPIRLNPLQRQAIEAGRPLVFEDSASMGDLVPREWILEFRLASLVVVPLMKEDEPLGVLVVDWPARRAIDPDEVAVLEATAACAALAIRNARLYEATRRRAARQEALTQAAAALVVDIEPEEAAERLVDAYAELLGARVCAIGLFDSDRTKITTVAARRAASVAGPVPLDSIPRHLVERVWEAWESDKSPIEMPADPWFEDVLGRAARDVETFLLFPLVVEGHARGIILLGLGHEIDFDDEDRSAAQALADIASSALERQLLRSHLERHYLQLDALYQASIALSKGGSTADMVRQLNHLLAPLGIKVVGVAFRDRGLAARLGGQEPTPEERQAWRGAKWCQGEDPLVLADGNLAVPMRLGRRVVGTLRVVPSDLDAEMRSFVEALARGLAEVARREVLRGDFEEARRDQAIAHERERLASDLHDTAGQALVAIGLLARDHAEYLRAGDQSRTLFLRLGDLADEGKWEIDQAVRALTFLPAVQDGLVSSMRKLLTAFTADSGIEASFRIDGKAVRLDAEAERALYRVAHEALANAWRHARCSTVDVVLEYHRDEVVLRVVDDGVGLGSSSAHVGITGMRRAMLEVGGSLDLTDVGSGGAMVRARLETNPPGPSPAGPGRGRSKV